MMFFSACVGVASTIVLFVSPAFAADKTIDPQLVAKLITAATMRDRLDLLSDDQLLYNFSANPMYSWKPGSVCNANAATWPILSTIGVSVAQLNLGPCAMLAPHLHRANNLVVSVTGTTHTYMVQENGARLVEQMLSPGMMTIFPLASVHSMYNMGKLHVVAAGPLVADIAKGCENNQLYSFLDDKDPGTTTLAQTFFLMPEEIGMQVMPFINLTNGDWNATAQLIPAIGNGSQDGFEACRRKCGLA